MLLLIGAAGCSEEEVASDCYPAVVKDQGCGTVLAILDVRAAEVLGVKPKDDSVWVNTFSLPPVYQVPGKRLFVRVANVPKNETPSCPGFIPVVYPHVRLLSFQEAPCQ